MACFIQRKEQQMVKIMYQPRIEDEVVIAEFSTREQAEQEMARIEKNNPKAFPYHYIKEDVEHGGPKGLEPTRYMTWEAKGREVDF